MGIITKEVEVRPTGKSIQYYRNKGYDVKWRKPLIVKVEDLPNGSSVNVDILCDYCNEEIITVPYNIYLKRLETVQKIACIKCKPIKTRECNLINYGVINTTQLDSVRECIRLTTLSKYGTEHYSQTAECKERIKRTCEEKYGNNYQQLFSERAFNSFYEKTGYKYPSQSPEVREKILKSINERYGVYNPSQSLDVKEKITNTYYQNSSQKASTQQRYICKLYSGILNFPIKFYNVDIYLSEDNLICEFDGSGHMLNVTTGRETIEEYKQKEIIRNSIIKREGYKQMRIVTTTDLIPSDEILLQLLSHSKEYFSTTSHTWITWDIDNSKMINAENKDTDGVFFDYGELRKIKKSDILEKSDENCA